MKLSIVLVLLVTAMIMLILIFIPPVLHTLYPYEQLPINAITERMGEYSVVSIYIPMFVIGFLLTSYLNKRAVKLANPEKSPSASMRSKFLGVQLNSKGKLWLVLFSFMLSLILSLGTTVVAILVNRVVSVKNGLVIMPEEEKFSAELPRKVYGIKRNPQSITFEEGELKGSLYTAKNGKSPWLIGSYQSTSSTIDLSKQEVFHRVASILTQNFVKKINGQIEKAVEHDFNGTPGVSCLINGKDQNQDIFMRIDMVAKQNQLYQILYIATSKDELVRDDVKRYFQSFQVK